jgi:phospholipid transport system substrate-binding protein
LKNNALMLFFLLALSAWLVPVQAGAPDLASALVKDTTDRMLAALQTRRAELDEKPALIYGLVDEIVIPHFDFERITGSAMGRHWRQASPEQKQALIRAFRQMLVRTYAKALLTYAEQEILILPLRPGKRPEQVTVRTEVKQSGGPAIPIDYQLYLKGDAWKVFDIAIDGISLVANYRSSFDAQVRRDGIDGLIRALDARNADGSS